MLFVLRRQRRADDICGFEFALRVKVGINVARCAYIAVTEPFLYLLHRYAVGEHQRRAGVPQIVKADLEKLTFLCYDKRVI